MAPESIIIPTGWGKVLGVFNSRRYSGMRRVALRSRELLVTDGIQLCLESGSRGTADPWMEQTALGY